MSKHPALRAEVMIVEFYILLGVWLASCAFLVGLAHLHNWRVAGQKLRVPVAEKLLRGPGESLRKKLEELDEQLSLEMMVAYVLPLVCTSALIIQRLKAGSSEAEAFLLAGMGATVYIFVCLKILRLLKQRRNYRLGLGGERAVGEELNLMMLEGCRVFHDVPNDPYGNTDHVLVAPSGVYAVETKARRKRDAMVRDAHKVTFDGRSLQFGEGPSEFECLDQAC